MRCEMPDARCKMRLHRRAVRFLDEYDWRGASDRLVAFGSFCPADVIARRQPARGSSFPPQEAVSGVAGHKDNTQKAPQPSLPLLPRAAPRGPNYRRSLLEANVL